MRVTRNLEPQPSHAKMMRPRQWRMWSKRHLVLSDCWFYLNAGFQIVIGGEGFWHVPQREAGGFLAGSTFLELC